MSAPYLALGSIIRTARVRSLMEQKTLAETVGVTDRAVRDWEKGHSRPTLRRIPTLAAILELDAVELATLADSLEVAKTEDSENAGLTE